MAQFHHKFRNPRTGSRLLLLAAIALFCLQASRSTAQSFTTDEVKAALLIKFTDFIRWPDGSFSKHPDDFVLGILGEDRLSELLAPLTGRDIQGKQLIVKVFDDVADIDQAQVLFIAGVDEQQLSGIFSALSGRPILTVGESPGFAQRGGIVNFIDKKGKVGFEINIDARKRSPLKISSHLMRLAEIVTDSRGEAP